MNKVKEEPVSYSTYQGKHKKFYRQIYFEYICLLITDLYKETVPDNEFCNDFLVGGMRRLRGLGQVRQVGRVRQVGQMGRGENCEL